jgi:hypothetical protein
MTPREIVRQTVSFQNPPRLPWDLPPAYGSDIAQTGMSPSPDDRPMHGTARDEWGVLWENIGVCNLGEAKEHPLASWDDMASLDVPDIHDPKRWSLLETAREQAGEKYLIGYGVSLYERVHFLRGLENTWIDIHENPEELGRLIDILVEMNLVAIERFAAAGVDAIMWPDDWGLQDRLMIAPDAWRAIWKPRYTRVYEAAHAAGMQTFLHSCGNIVSILDDLIEAGLDVIQMDQQENMGVEDLGQRFGGRITFFCPVDIQNTMARGKADEIRDYAARLVRHLARPEGGFIAKWYPDPVGAGHTNEAIAAMSEAFVEACSVSQETPKA